MYQKIKKELKFVRQQIKKYYNQKKLKKPTFSEKNLVYLAIKNIITKKPSKKLDYKYLKLYKVTKKISKNNYQLDLPPKVRIYPIFYISLLKNAINVKPISTERNNVKINEKEYKAEKVFNTYNYQGKIEYLVK